MMALEEPESGYTWLQVPPDRAIDVTIIGEAHTWWTHWVRNPLAKRQRAVRCVRGEGRECLLCACGWERRARYVIPVLFDGQPRLLELGRAQYPTLVSTREFHGWLGQVLRISRERPQINAPIYLRRTDSIPFGLDDAIDVGAYVRNLGLLELKDLEQSDFMPTAGSLPGSRNGKHPRER